MLLRPNKTKFKKIFKGKIYGIEQKAVHLKFGTVGLKSLEIGRLSAKQIEATRRVIARKLKRMGKVFIRIYPSIPVTSKPIEVRMGKGKGSVDYWICRVKPGQILYEIGGIQPSLAMAALKSAAQKLPIMTTLIKK
jgi:large subunit ribosomal protein L16